MKNKKKYEREKNKVKKELIKGKNQFINKKTKIVYGQFSSFHKFSIFRLRWQYE